MVFFWIGLAVLGGIAVALQAIVMGVVSEQVGWVGNVFIVYVIGFVLACGLALLLGQNTLGYFRQLHSWHQFSAGFFGVVIVSTIGICSYKLGVVPTLVLVFVAQLLSGKLLAQHGLLGVARSPLTFSEGMAMLLLISGTVLLLYSKQGT